MMNSRSLSFRLLIWHSALLSVVFLTLGFSTYVAVRAQLQRHLGQNQLRRARLIAALINSSHAPPGEASLAEQIRVRFAPETNGRFIRVSRPDASVLYISGSPEDKSFDPSRISPVQPKAHPAERIVRNDNLLIGSVAVPGPGGSYLIESGAPLAGINSFLNHLLVILVLGFPTLTAVAIVGGRLLLRQALAPVQQACQTAERITARNLSERLPTVSCGDELEQLTQALNRMISRLEEALLHDHRFMADASHEMRTPLTVIRGELEALAQNAGLGLQARDCVGCTLEEVQRLATIVENLFAIARLDAGEVPMKWTVLDLASLAKTTSDQMTLLAEDKGLTIRFLAPNAVWAQGDPSRLKQVVVNLLDNAIKYTPRGGTIELSVLPFGDDAVIEVADNGIGIPTECQQYVFERFYRVDKARSREMGGAGLGLAIVKSICALHSGTVHLESSEGLGSRFRVELPRLTRGNAQSTLRCAS